MSFIKNISKSEVLTLKEQVSYQKGQVVSKTLAQNDALSVTLFAFDKDEEISTHDSIGDAMVHVIDGVGQFTVDGAEHICKAASPSTAKLTSCMKASPSLCRPSIRMLCMVRNSLRCCWLSYFKK